MHCLESISHPVPEGNNGCYGGNMYNSFMYIIFNDGVDKELSYPYENTVSSQVVTKSLWLYASIQTYDIRI